MTLVAALTGARALGTAFFETRDLGAKLGTSPAHASQIVRRLAGHGLIGTLGRGRWFLPERAAPLDAVAILAAPHPAYVSLRTALHRHGLIAQVPGHMEAITLGRSRRVATPLGTYAFHHASPRFFFGYQPWGEGGILMATPEKALLDLLYFGASRPGTFRAWPELEFPRSFRWGDMRTMARKISCPRRRAWVLAHLDKLRRQAT
ncbi:MAG: type IV toxin-antitoxin system AbiEi family antitoxin domain-containing protein [Verrucomicrobiia bacterium]|jgi:predicted transcriptional regulator of viral defense system